MAFGSPWKAGLNRFAAMIARMAFDPGSLTSALSVAAGEDDALIAELRAAFLESARRHTDLLARSRCDANWTLAAGRLKGLAASFGMDGLVDLALEAEAGAPGDPVVQRKIAQGIAELSG